MAAAPAHRPDHGPARPGNQPGRARLDPEYYGAFGLKELFPLLQSINYYLVRWLHKKYRRLRTWKKLLPCWERITSQYPEMFAHWRQVNWYWRTG